MSYLTISCLLIAVISSNAQEIEFTNQFAANAVTECQAQTGIDDESLSLILAYEDDNADQVMKCFEGCWLKKVGLVVDAVPNIENLEQWSTILYHGDESAIVFDIDKRCAEQMSETEECEAGHQFLNCFFIEAKEMGVSPADFGEGF